MEGATNGREELDVNKSTSSFELLPGPSSLKDCSVLHTRKEHKHQQLSQGKKRATRTHLAEELSNRRVVALLRKIRDVERRLPGNADLDLGVVNLFLVLGESGGHGILQGRRKT